MFDQFFLADDLGAAFLLLLLLAVFFVLLFFVEAWALLLGVASACLGVVSFLIGVIDLGVAAFGAAFFIYFLAASNIQIIYLFS